MIKVIWYLVSLELKGKYFERIKPCPRTSASLRRCRFRPGFNPLSTSSWTVWTLKEFNIIKLFQAIIKNYWFVWWHALETQVNKQLFINKCFLSSYFMDQKFVTRVVGQKTSLIYRRHSWRNWSGCATFHGNSSENLFWCVAWVLL